jgi:hypothetical protein
MSRDNLDRALRTWLEPGAERAPERFVWQALDQVESTQQRHPWVTRLADSGRTLRPVIRPLAMAGVILAAAVIVATVATQNVGQPAEPPREYTTEDLASIVVWEETKPASWTLDELVTNAGAVLTLPVRTMTPVQFEDLPAMRGYVGGRYTNFSGPDSALSSWAVVFESPADADQALPVFANEMAASDGWGLGPGEAVDLGAEGLVFTGETRSLMGAPSGDPVPMRLYLWRKGNMLLALGGWFEFDAEELRRVAEAMDARAR